jgi:hypothetical protein
VDVRSTAARPFLGSEALAAGTVTRRGLHRDHQQIYRDVYLVNGQSLTAASRAEAAWLWSGRRGVVAGKSAAALLRSKWIDAALPAELIRKSGKGVRGIAIFRDELRAAEVRTVRGISVTTPARTAFDIGRRNTLEDAVIHLDALANATKITSAEVHDLATQHRGARGLTDLRKALQEMDGGAESPQETRTRLVLTGAGLPKPTTQVTVYDEGGYPFARIDMAYEDCRVGIEYDGEQHWTDSKRRAHDIDKSVELTEHGWIIVRVSADMLRYRPWVVVNRVVDALRAAGCEWLADCPLATRFPHENLS